MAVGLSPLCQSAENFVAFAVPKQHANHVHNHHYYACCRSSCTRCPTNQWCLLFWFVFALWHSRRNAQRHCENQIISQCNFAQQEHVQGQDCFGCWLWYRYFEHVCCQGWRKDGHRCMCAIDAIFLLQPTDWHVRHYWPSQTNCQGQWLR